MSEAAVIASVVGLLGSGVLVALVYYKGYQRGRDGVLKDVAEKSLKVKDAQLKAMAAKPSASDRLRDCSF